MYTVNELEKFPVSKFPTHLKVDAFYDGSKAIESFVSSTVLKVLDNQLSINKKEKAVIETYYRMYFWLCTIISLNQPRHFQGLASAGRAIFELLIDENLLIYDLIENGLEKHTAFTQIERYRAAKQVVDYETEHPESKLADETYREFVNSPGKNTEIENLKVQYWGRNKKGDPNKTEYWSGMSARARAKVIDKKIANTNIKYEELYLTNFPMQSWMIHSGSVGVENITLDSTEAIIGLSHGTAQTCMLEATRIVGIFMHLDKAIGSFFKIIDRLKLVPGESLLKEQIKLLKEAENKQ